jgi:hypothetical protein
MTTGIRRARSTKHITRPVPGPRAKKDEAVVAKIELQCDENMKQTGGGERHVWK